MEKNKNQMNDENKKTADSEQLEKLLDSTGNATYNAFQKFFSDCGLPMCSPKSKIIKK